MRKVPTRVRVYVEAAEGWVIVRSQVPGGVLFAR